MIKSRRAVVAALVCVLPTVPLIAWAQKAAPKAPAKPPVKTPATAPAAAASKTAAQILDGYVNATGGKAAYAKVTSMQSRGTVAIPAQGIKGTIFLVAKAPNKVYSEQDIEGIGKSTSGFDGKVGWSKDPFNGVRTLSGAELATLKREADFNSAIEWRTQYKTAELLGIKQVNGKDAYAIKLTPAVGAPVTQYHDTATLLIVRSDSVQETPAGNTPVESYPSDYRDVNGVKMAFGGRILLGQAEVVTTLTDVKVNIPVDDSKFAKPTE